MKRASLSAIAMSVLALVLLGSGLWFIPQVLNLSEPPSLNITNQSDFVPFESNPDFIEQLALDSLNGLVLAINSVVRDDDVAFSTGSVETRHIPFERYEIRVAANIQLDQSSGLFVGNQNRYWIFSTQRSISDHDQETISKEDYFAIPFNYHYGLCSSRRTWVTCPGAPDAYCYCNTADRGISEASNRAKRSVLYQQAARTSLAAVYQADTVYNIELRTFDAEGNVMCTAKTTWDNLINTRASDLETWGSAQQGRCAGDGCDMNGNGVFGSYGSTHWNKDPRSIGQDLRVSNTLFNSIFPQGVILPSDDNGEGCYDSPTWVECDGIRVFYCGKQDHAANAVQPNQFFYQRDKNVVNARARAHFMAVYEPTNTDGFSGRQQSGRSSVARVDSSSISVLDFSTRSTESFRIGAPDYYRSYGISEFLGGLFKGIGDFFYRYDNPDVQCQGGQRVGMTGIPSVRCEGGNCHVCGFNLLQPENEIVSNYWTSFIEGHGDPAFVVYFNAFPMGEDQYWQMSEFVVGYQTLFMISTVTTTVTTALPAAIRYSSRLFKNVFTANVVGIAKMHYRLGADVLGPLVRSATQSVRLTTELVELTARQSSSLVRTQSLSTSQRVMRLHESVTDRLTNLHLPEIRRAITQFPSNVETYLRQHPYRGSATIIGSSTVQSAEVGLANYLGAAYLYEQSLLNKFKPVGVNAIGMHRPYWTGSIKSGLSFDALDDGVKNYTLVLVKDEYKGLLGGLLSQNSQRFYLASPCENVNLAIGKAPMKCWNTHFEGNSLYSVAPPSMRDVFGRSVFETASLDMRYASDDARRYQFAEKYCLDRSANWFRGSPVYESDVIFVNPVPASRDSYGTFCYGGSSAHSNILTGGVIAGAIILGTAVDVGAAAGTAATGGLAAPVIFGIRMVANFGIDVGLVFTEHLIDDASKWPNHRLWDGYVSQGVLESGGNQ